MATQLLEVEWHAFDKETQYPYYRTCDICEYCATDDIGNDPNWLELRQWFQEIRDGEKTTVCSGCLDKYLVNG